METEKIKRAIEIALENAGIFADLNDEDINLINMFEDSIQFIMFIVKLEEDLKIDIPNELLIFDNFKSIKNIIDILNAAVQMKIEEKE